MNTKSNFSSRLGFVLATAGSAVGLGNIWRFPYLAAKYGGGSFLLIYIILAITFGFTLMITELAIGRKTGKSVIGAFTSLDKRFSFLGYLAGIVPMIILPYYCVIGGWVIKYGTLFISGQTGYAAADGTFTGFIGSTAGPLSYFFLFIACTAAVVFLGVEKGVEKVSKILMPLLVILTIGIAVYVLTMDGAMAGVKYYLTPDFSKISMNAVCAAMSQLFYSMSIAMGILVTYGSYMKKDNHLEQSVRQIEIFDTAIAFMAGLMIVPAAYMFYGGSTEDLKKGPTLMFVILPKVFEEMPGIMGTIIGVAFFLLVFFAALTSSISLMETVVSIVMDKTKWERKFTCMIVTVFCLIMGIPSSLGFNIWGHITFLNGLTFLDLFDFVSNSVIMPVVAFFTCILIGFVVKPKTVVEEVKVTDGTFKSEKLFTVMIKWVAPIFILAILVFSVAEGMGWITV